MIISIVGPENCMFVAGSHVATIQVVDKSYNLEYFLLKSYCKSKLIELNEITNKKSGIGETEVGF